MNAIARAYQKGILPAQIMTAALTLSALLLQPLVVFVAAGIAMVCMSIGLPAAVKLCLTAILINTSINYLIVGEWQTGLFYSLALLIPLLGSAQVLSKWQNTAKAFLFLVGCCTFFLMALRLNLDSNTWLEYLRSILQQAQVDFDNATLEQLAKQMNSLLTLGLFVLLSVSLLLGRYWQSQAYKPKAFGREFRAYNLGKAPSLLALSILALGLLELAFFSELVPVIICLFVFQGIALFHQLKHHFSLHSLTTLGFYCALIFFPLFLLLVAVVGFADIWLQLKQHLQSNVNAP